MDKSGRKMIQQLLNQISKYSLSLNHLGCPPYCASIFTDIILRAKMCRQQKSQSQDLSKLVKLKVNHWSVLK